jgi:hypothetical protein
VRRLTVIRRRRCRSSSFRLPPPLGVLLGQRFGAAPPPVWAAPAALALPRRPSRVDVVILTVTRRGTVMPRPALVPISFVVIVVVLFAPTCIVITITIIIVVKIVVACFFAW